MTRLIIPALVALLVCGQAWADQIVWTCAYPGFGEKNETVIVKFTQNGKSLKGGFHDFTILQDNNVGLVAASSFSYIAPSDGVAPGLNLGAIVIMIDKKTMRFRRGNVFMSTPHAGVAYGKCTK